MNSFLNLERDAFNAFLDSSHADQHTLPTLEAALSAFRAYERDLARLKAKLQPSIEQANRGDARPLDLDSLLDRVRRRVEQCGNQ